MKVALDLFRSFFSNSSYRSAQNAIADADGNTRVLFMRIVELDLWTGGEIRNIWMIILYKSKS